MGAIATRRFRSALLAGIAVSTLTHARAQEGAVELPSVSITASRLDVPSLRCPSCRESLTGRREALTDDLL